MSTMKPVIRIPLPSREREGTRAERGEGEGAARRTEIIAARRVRPHLPVASRRSEASAVSVRRSKASPRAPQRALLSICRRVSPASGEGACFRPVLHLLCLTIFFLSAVCPSHAAGRPALIAALGAEDFDGRVTSGHSLGAFRHAHPLPAPPALDHGHLSTT